VALTLIPGFWGCGEPVPPGPPTVRITVPAGANFSEVVDTLAARDLVNMPALFRAYARLKDAETRVRSGAYAFAPGTPWSLILRDLTEGRVLTETLTIPEGFRLTQIAPRVGELTGLSADTVLAILLSDYLEERFGVPGPGLEGYLFPETYFFARGAPLDTVLGAMVSQYRAFWTPERIDRRRALGMTEGEVVTLASIVQAEARAREEMPLIASVYHNRLAIGQLLQADPTVLYALGGHRDRLLFAAMDSVADHPYNTYTHVGLPPGPIGSPGEEALEAALSPAPSDYYYFVARTDGTHVFSRTLAEHNQAVARLRSDWERYRREQRERTGAGESPEGP
jgi:UPF0755 protein